MCGSGQKCGHPELWLVEVADSRGVEADLQMWREAELFLDHLYNLYEDHHNEGVVMVLGMPTPAASKNAGGLTTCASYTRFGQSGV